MRFRRRVSSQIQSGGFTNPPKTKKFKLPSTQLFVLYMGVACMSYIVLGKKLDKIEILARTQGLKRDTNERMSVV